MSSKNKYTWEDEFYLADYDSKLTMSNKAMICLFIKMIEAEKSNPRYDLVNASYGFIPDKDKVTVWLQLEELEEKNITIE